MPDDNYHDQLSQLQEELNHAENARAKGNEGMARVCSRRAAGIAIGIFLSRNGFTNFGTSAYERLNIIKTLPNIPHNINVIAGHLLLRVNEDHKLPNDIDLIEDARRLVDFLLFARGKEV